MNELEQIECRYTGPIPTEERWVLRLGSRAAHERARGRAAVRYLKAECVRLIGTGAPSVAMHDDVVRRRLAEQARWAAA